MLKRKEHPELHPEVCYIRSERKNLPFVELPFLLFDLLQDFGSRAGKRIFTAKQTSLDLCWGERVLWDLTTKFQRQLSDPLVVEILLGILVYICVYGFQISDDYL
jgi:hypothetical protein